MDCEAFSTQKKSVHTGFSATGVQSSSISTTFPRHKQRYIRNFFSDDQENLNIHDIKLGYYKMISEEYFQNTYPAIKYNRRRQCLYL